MVIYQNLIKGPRLIWGAGQVGGGGGLQKEVPNTSARWATLTYLLTCPAKLPAPPPVAKQRAWPTWPAPVLSKARPGNRGSGTGVGVYTVSSFSCSAAMLHTPTYQSAHEHTDAHILALIPRATPGHHHPVGLLPPHQALLSFHRLWPSCWAFLVDLSPFSLPETTEAALISCAL